MVKRWVVIVTILLTAFSLWKLYPGWVRGDFSAGMTPALNLGLDLQGGTYLKYQVETDQIPKDANGQPKVAPREAVDRALEIIRNRVDSMGLKEPLIQREGDQYVVVQLPGDKDPARTQSIIGSTAQLNFQLVSDRYRVSDYVDADGNTRAKLPDGIELLHDRTTKEPMLVESHVLMTGAMLSKAMVDFNSSQFGQPVIAFELTKEGEGLFGSITEENVQRRLAIVLDGVVQSAPVIKSAIRGSGESLRPMLLTVVGTVVFRVIWLLVVVPMHHMLQTMLMVYPVTWILTAFLFVAYHHFGHWLSHAERRRDKLELSI